MAPVQIQCCGSQSFVVVVFFSSSPTQPIDACADRGTGRSLPSDTFTSWCSHAGCRASILTVQFDFFHTNTEQPLAVCPPILFLSLCEITFNEYHMFFRLPPLLFIFNLCMSSCVNRGSTQRELFHYNSTHTLFTPTAWECCSHILHSLCSIFMTAPCHSQDRSHHKLTFKDLIKMEVRL